jgi:branched-chain amino acid transport system ATP-binding protein
VAPLLELRGVEASYGPVKALHGVSLSVDEGEIVAVLGANGAGKTTALRAVSGLVRHSGEIVFDGTRIERASPERVARLGIAHVPEGRGIFDELTVLENLRLGSYVRRDGSWKAELERVTGYFPWLERRGDQQAGTLSGGEQQMLALGRALTCSRWGGSRFRARATSSPATKPSAGRISVTSHVEARPVISDGREGGAVAS